MSKVMEAANKEEIASSPAKVSRISRIKKLVFGEGFLITVFYETSKDGGEYWSSRKTDIEALDFNIDSHKRTLVEGVYKALDLTETWDVDDSDLTSVELGYAKPSKKNPNVNPNQLLSASILLTKDTSH